MCDGNHTTRFKQDCVDGSTGHSWTSRGSNHGVPAVFTIIIIVIIVLDFATEFGSYPPLKVIYHPAGFYNSAVSFLWKTRCSIIIIIITYTVWTRWIEVRGTMGMPRPHSTTDLPAPDCLVQVNRNWSDFLSVKSNASSPYNSTKLMNEWSPRRRISFENTRPPSGKQRNYSYTPTCAFRWKLLVSRRIIDGLDWKSRNSKSARVSQFLATVRRTIMIVTGIRT